MSAGRCAEPNHCPTTIHADRQANSIYTQYTQLPTTITTTTTTTTITCKVSNFPATNRNNLVFFQVFVDHINTISVVALVVWLLQLQLQKRNQFSRICRTWLLFPCGDCRNSSIIATLTLDLISQQGTHPTLDQALTPNQISTTTRHRLVARDQGKVTPHDKTT